MTAPGTSIRPPRVASAVLCAVVLLGIGAVGAIRAGLAGADFMFDLEQARPALARVPPTIAPAVAPRLARKVVVVIIDGLRYDTSRTMPQLTAWRSAGLDAMGTSHYPSWSRPNYTSIFTGVPPQASGIRTNAHNTPIELDTLMDRAHDVGLRVAVAADNEAMPKLFLRPPRATVWPDVDGSGAIDIDAMEDPESEAAMLAADFDVVSPFDDARYVPWPGGLADAGRAMIAAPNDLVVLLIGVVDRAGHAHGADSDEYRLAAAIADRAVARAVRGIDLALDTLIVVADHGHSDSGGHGGVEPEVMQVPFIIVGAGVEPGARLDGPRLIDVAPTVAGLLGMAPPGHGLGRTLVEGLALTPAHRAALTTSDTARTVHNQTIVDLADAQFVADTQTKRASRITTIAALTLGLVLCAVGASRIGGLRMSPRVLLLSVPAFFVVYYALIGTVGQRFSPSILPERGTIVWELCKYGVIGTGAHLLTGWLALRRRVDLAERLAAANGVALVGLFLTIVPAALLWAYFPPPYVHLPGPRLLVLIPAVQVAVACYAIGVALSLLLELIVFFARAADPVARVARLERALVRTRARITVPPPQ